MLSLFCSTVALVLVANAYGKEDQIKIEIVKAPANCDRKAKFKDVVRFHYAAMLLNGTVFDSSYKRQKPHIMSLGNQEFIKGLHQGMVGMCREEKRKLTIPHELAYSEQENRNVPTGVAVIYEVELLNFMKIPSLVFPNFDELDLNRDGKITKSEYAKFLSEKHPKKQDNPDWDNEIFRMVEFAFWGEDYDKDGVITLSEFIRKVKNENKIKNHEDL